LLSRRDEKRCLPNSDEETKMKTFRVRTPKTKSWIDTQKAEEVVTYDRTRKTKRPGWGQQWDQETFRLAMSEYDRIIAFAAIHHSAEKLILVPGVGTGTDVRMLSQYGCQVIGVDISAEQIRKAIAIAEFQNVSYIIGDAEYLPLRANVADTIWCRAILHHLPNLGKAIAEFRASSKEGSVLVAAEPGLLNPVAMVARRFFPTDVHTRGERPFIPHQFESAMCRKGYRKVACKRFFLLVLLAPVTARWAPLLRPIAVMVTRVLVKFEDGLFRRFPTLSNLCWIFLCVFQRTV
jgi:SAM-dependent methyltransferase